MFLMEYWYSRYMSDMEDVEKTVLLHQLKEMENDLKRELC